MKESKFSKLEAAMEEALSEEDVSLRAKKIHDAFVRGSERIKGLEADYESLIAWVRITNEQLTYNESCDKEIAARNSYYRKEKQSRKRDIVTLHKMLYSFTKKAIPVLEDDVSKMAVEIHDLWGSSRKEYERVSRMQTKTGEFVDIHLFSGTSIYDDVMQEIVKAEERKFFIETVIDNLRVTPYAALDDEKIFDSSKKKSKSSEESDNSSGEPNV